MSQGADLARFAAELTWDRVPVSIQSKIVEHTIDIIGVICAGVETPEGLSCQGTAREWGSSGPCTIVARGWRLPAPAAAFVNAFHGRINTFDDTYEVGPIHPGSSAFSAAFACAEKARLSGSEFLVASLVGYEVGTRVSASVSPSHYIRGFQNTGTCNVFTAAAAAGRALGLDANSLLEAFGLAGESAAGLRQYQVDGSMVDSAYSGARAALLGVMAAELRAGGLAGPRGILEGKWGFCHTMAENADLTRLVDGLGETYEFAATTLKPYASCRYTHGPVEELLRLRAEHNIEPGDVESVTIYAFRESSEVSDRPRLASSTDAVLSHQYAASVALSTGDVKLSYFGDRWQEHASCIQFAERVKVVHDPALDCHFPSSWPHRVEIRLRSGRLLSADSSNPPGGPDRPVSRQTVHNKFRELAGPILGEERASQVITAVEALPGSNSLAPLSSLLFGGAPVSHRTDRAIAPAARKEQVS